MKKQGKFTLIYGCMFSGKTTQLLDLLRENNKNEPLIFSPFKDNRAGKNLINTHDGLNIEVIKFEYPSEILNYINDNTIEIGIDELQFCSIEIIETIKILKAKGIDVYGTGLNLDYLNKPFGSMPDLMKFADKNVQLFAWCHCCGSLAEFTHRTSDSIKIIDPGGIEKYEARCKDCL